MAVVSYPLFARVGAREWAAYHAAHSDRITWVVAPPMVVELVGSVALVVERPEGMAVGAAFAGVVLAALAWVLTLVAASAHGRFVNGLDGRSYRILTRVHWLRTAVWTAHAALLLAVFERAGG